MNGKKLAAIAAVGCLRVGGAALLLAAGAFFSISRGSARDLSSALRGRSSGPPRAVMSADRINGLFYMQRYCASRSRSPTTRRR